MSKFEYTEEMVERMKSEAPAEGSGEPVSEEVIQKLMEDFEFPRRSITAKYRKLGYTTEIKKNEPVFSVDETNDLKVFLNDNEGVYTAEEISQLFADGKFTARQINGKALSLELTGAIKPAEKKVVPKSYTEEQEATIVEMVESGAFMEDIAAALGKEVASVRGKLLSMKLKAPQKEKKATKTDAYEGIEDMAADMTVQELADHFGKTTRGVKTVLSRRNLACKDYSPPKKKESDDS